MHRVPVNLADVIHRFRQKKVAARAHGCCGAAHCTTNCAKRRVTVCMSVWVWGGGGECLFVCMCELGGWVHACTYAHDISLLLA